MPSVGDKTTVQTVVTPYDNTTAAALALTSPTGVTTNPAASSADSKHTWTAAVTWTAAGIWTFAWTVTGTGAGGAVPHYEQVTVGPALAASALTGRTYATSADLAAYLQTAPPLDADRMLRRATALIDQLLLCARYDVDGDGEPTDTTVKAALAKAACAQVAWWIATGDELGAIGEFQQVSIGNVSLARGRGAKAPAEDRYGPDVMPALVEAQLVGHAPWVW